VKLALRILAIVVLLIQFVRPEKTNPSADAALALQQNMEVPAAVDEMLRTSCFDCHSNETEWPWYASVAPSSWLVVHDVNEGRRHLNFSEWGNYPPRVADHKLEEVIEMVEEEEMPLGVYLILHGDARLDAGQRSALVQWAGAARNSVHGEEPDR
jgi:hypothetical protein